MLRYGGFEGNGQTLRVIARLDNRTENHGLDLTRRAVLGVIKYPAPYSDAVNWGFYPGGLKLSCGSIFRASDFKPPKCYLNEEHDIVQDWVAKGLNGEEWNEFSRVTPKPPKKGKQRHKETNHKSLDASIMELADDIAYGVHDLEDAIALKLIDRHSFEKWFKEEDCNGEIREHRLQPLLDTHFGAKFSSLTERLFDKPHIRKRAIGRMVAFFVKSVQISGPLADQIKCPLLHYRAELGNRENEIKALKALKDIVGGLVINRPEVQQLEFKGQQIVTKLFEAFVTDPQRLLEDHDYERTTEGGGDTPTERVVCDFIAGMTDGYAITRYRQLFIPRAGSIFDRL